jgi:hypothetical protein
MSARPRRARPRASARFDPPQQDCMGAVFDACLPARLGATAAYAPFYALGG